MHIAEVDVEEDALVHMPGPMVALSLLQNDIKATGISSQIRQGKHSNKEAHVGLQKRTTP